MQTTDGNNKNIPASPSQLSPLQIPKHEPLSPLFQGPQISTQGDPSSSSHNSTNAFNSITATTTTTIMSNSKSSSPKNPLCGPPWPEQSPSSLTRIRWPLKPPQQPPPFQHSSMMPYYSPIGLPPQFPFFSMPFTHDQFHPFQYPMIPGNNNDFNGQIYSQPWSTGLFDCFTDLKNSFITCLCPCITFGQVDEILSERQITWWEGALMFGLLELFSCQTSFVFAWYHRMQFRKKYNLMGNLFSELAIALFCMRLVLCQNYRQLNKLGFDVALGWKANMKKQRRISSQAAIQFVPPMVYPGMFR
ncbi:unnamed protein product [Withania somnifera]